MARVSGVNIPENKRVVVALTYIYGIGDTKAKAILEKVKIDESVRTKDLTDAQLDEIRDEVKKHVVEGDARREKLLNIRRLQDIKSYRGSRHAKKLPARGQRTKTNSRSVRGNKRMTMGSGRKATGQKT